MSEAVKQKSSKKKLTLKIMCGALGIFAAVYLFLVIYTNYIHPPMVAVDGKAGMIKALEKAKERKEKQIEEIRSKSPDYKGHKKSLEEEE